MSDLIEEIKTAPWLARTPINATEAIYRLFAEVESLTKDMFKQDVYITEMNEVHRIKIESLTTERDELKDYQTNNPSWHAQSDIFRDKLEESEAENAALKTKNDQYMAGYDYCYKVGEGERIKKTRSRTSIRKIEGKYKMYFMRGGVSRSTHLPV